MAVKINKKEFAAPIESLQQNPEWLNTEDVPALTDKQIVANTTVSSKVNGVENSKDTTEALGSVISSKPLCNVGVNAKQTVNMGNYNSISVGVSINVPCEYQDIDETYIFAKTFVDNRMGELMEDVEKAKQS